MGALETVVVGAVVLVPESVAPGVSVTVDRFGADMDTEVAAAAAVVLAVFVSLFAVVDCAAVWVFVSVF